MNAELTRKLDQLAIICDGVIQITRGDKRIQYACEKAHATAGYGPRELLGMDLVKLLPGSVKFMHDDMVDDYMESAGETSRDMSTRVVAIRQKSGRMREVQIVIQAIDGNPVAALFHNEDRMAAFRAVRDGL